ncbi:hypothetical protein QR680_001270 [Steinernema hermaphroditum]|uniref:Uncharacterized protein n=1 Tax=Steinernema hermaphroditum TaxID=289476 RepID=A0AA39LFJ7_9BILA|nr:hypothetical protein QR680_001270 [Steinernema hermaphroditum]
MEECDKLQERRILRTEREEVGEKQSPPVTIDCTNSNGRLLFRRALVPFIGKSYYLSALYGELPHDESN